MGTRAEAALAIGVIGALVQAPIMLFDLGLARRNANCPIGRKST